MSTEKVKVVLDIEAEVGKIEGALKTLRGDMSNLQLPKGIGKDFENRMSKLSDEIKNFHNLASKMGNSLEGAGKIDASYKKILEYTRKVENSLTAIKEEAGVDATKFFPKEIVDRIEKAEQAMKDYEAAIEKGRDAYKQEINDLKAVEKQLDNLRKKQISLEGTKTSKKTTLSETKERQKQVVQQANLTKQTSSQEQVAIQKRIALLKEEKEAIKVVQKAQEEASKTKVALKSVKGYDKGNLTQQKSYDSKKRNDDEARANLQRAQEAAKAYGDTLRSIPDIEAEIAAQNQALKQQETIYNQADAAIKKVNAEVDKASAAYNKANQELQDNTNQINQYVQEQERLNNAIKSGEAVAKNGAMNALANALKEINIIIDPTTQSLEEVKNIINNLKPEAIQQLIQALKNADINVDALELGLTELGNKNKVFQEGAQYARQMNNQMEQLKGHIQQFFSLTNSVMLFRRGIQKAFDAVKELDAAMTETAVVTDFSVGDMWDQLPRYTAAANELGTTTLGAYETMTLFYQQGLETNEVFEIGTETMKMARIAGLDYADATDLMTAALRGFNMELNEASATRINDVYSELAAITAADTSEIANAMTKTASIAANANMEFETTAALLSQIIETTREPAETAGTAMKTIIARFTEMKKASSEVINVDGEEVNVNKVEAALKSAGVALRDVNGEFRDLDDVFLELSSKWNSLDKMTQRYVATMAAGSRQQSRFIAMMQDYDRTMELVDAAYNSSGASQKQFEKTQESLESKINKLKNAWNEFLMGISNSKVIKAGVDALTGLLNVINKLTGKSGIAKLSVAILGLKTGSAIFNGLFKTFTPLKGIMNKQGQDTADSFLGGLTQRLNNFNNGKGFVLDVDIDTKGINSRLKNLKKDWSNFLKTLKGPQILDESSIGFKQVGNSLKTYAVQANGATNLISSGLSEVGAQALLSSANCGEIGKTLVKTGISGQDAINILTNTLDDLTQQASGLEKLISEHSEWGDLDDETMAAWQMDLDNTREKIKAVNGDLDTFSRKGKKSSNIISQGFSKLGQVLSKIPPQVYAIIAVVAAAGAALYALWKNSDSQVAQQNFEAAEKTAETFGKKLEEATEKVQELKTAWQELGDQEDALNDLVKGTTEWNKALSEYNAKVLEIIKNNKELSFSVDADGRFVIPEKEYEEYENKKQEEVTQTQLDSLAADAWKDYLEYEASVEKLKYAEGLVKYYQEEEIRKSQSIGDDDDSDFFGSLLNLIAQNYYKGKADQARTSLGLSENYSQTELDNLKNEKIAEYEATQKSAYLSYLDDFYNTAIASAAAEMTSSMQFTQVNRDLINTELGIDDTITNDSAIMWWTESSQKEALKKEWAVATGNTYRDGKLYNSDDEEIQIEWYGDGKAEKDPDKWITNEQLTKDIVQYRTSNGGREKAKEVAEVLSRTGTDISELYSGNWQNIDSQVITGLVNNKISRDLIANQIAGNRYNTSIEDLNQTEDAELISFLEAQIGKTYAEIEEAYKGQSVGQIIGNQLKIQAENVEETVKEQKKLLHREIINSSDEKYTEYNNYINQYNKTIDNMNNNEIGFLSDLQLNITENLDETTATGIFNAISQAYVDLRNAYGDNIEGFEEIGESFRQTWSSIDWSSPLTSLKNLNSLIQEGDENVSSFATNAKNALGDNFLSSANQLKEVLGSQDFAEEASAELEELYRQEGKITFDNIWKASEKSKTLQLMLDEGTISATGFAKSMELIAEGTFSATQMTSEFIDALSAAYELMDNMDQAHKWVTEYDFGKDYTEIGTTYADASEAVQNLAKGGAWGNPQFDEYMSFLLGEEEWQQALDKYDGNAKKAYEANKAQVTNIKGTLLANWKATINDDDTNKTNLAASFGKNGLTFDLEGISSTDALVQNIMENTSKTEEEARALVADAANYSAELSTALERLDKIRSLNKLLSGKKATNGQYSITDAEMEALGIDEEFLKSLTFKDKKTSITAWSSADKKAAKNSVSDSMEAAIKEKVANKEIKISTTLDSGSVETVAKTLEQLKTLNLSVDGVSIPEETMTIIQNTFNAQVDAGVSRGLSLDDAKKAAITGLGKVLGTSNATYLAAGLMSGYQDDRAVYAAAQAGAEQGKQLYIAIYTSITTAMADAFAAYSGMDLSSKYSTKGKIGAGGGEAKIVVNGTEYNVTQWNAALKAGTKGISGDFNTAFSYASSHARMANLKNTANTTANKNAESTFSVEEILRTQYNWTDEQIARVEKAIADGEAEVIELDDIVLPDGKTITDIYDEAGYEGVAKDDNDDNDDVNYEKESDKIKAKIDEIDSAIEDLADNDIVDMQLVNQLIDQKIALQREYKRALEQELGLLSASTSEIWSQVKQAGNDKYIEYNDETGGYHYTDAYYDDFFKNGVPIDSEQMQKVQDQINQLNQANSDQLSNQVAIRELVDQLVENQAENYNAERALKGRERRQTEADAEEELIGMLPEEIQPFFQALNTAEDARLEMQEIQANKILAENKKQELDTSYATTPDYIKEYLTFDEYSGYGIDLAKINQIEDQQTREDMMTAVQKNAEVLNTMYDEWYEVQEQLSGGKLQRAILNTGKSLQELAKEISDGDIDTGLKKINTGFKALDDALNSFIKNLEDNEAIENILSTKVLPSLSLNEEQATKLISNPKLQKALQGNVPLQNFVLQAIGTEGIDLGAILGAAFGQTGGLLEQIGGFLNFDMMKILGDSGGLIEQGKQIVEQIVGKVAEVTGALIDAWTNREDILYNFLNVLERYLHDYEVMQRYSTQLEKGRMASVDDIRQNWEQQWQSLQDQLEMQQERIETRQDQLDRSRWNPFQLISGWDPTSDSLYENRGVKMAFDLLISAIGMLPMGLGAFGGQLNQLYEDYDKRVQEAYEDRLAAEMAILDIEDERLELVKIGAEEATEFEQKVLDALIQKEQEQIEELSRLNDAITDANSKLISTLQKNLDQIRQDRENEKKEEELGEKERRLAYLRQDTSGANMLEIKKLEEELEEGHEDYTDTLIDQKISELEKQNEAAAEQRQQQIDLLQAQLDWSQKYGLYWDAIYGMLYTIDESGNAVLNPENFDLDGNIRENSQLAQMLGTFSDRLGMSVWSSVLDNEEAKRLGRYYGAFIGNNGVSGEWADYWALLNPGADDPDYATPMPEIPDGIWGVLYRIETSIGKYFGSSNMGLWNAGERLEVGLKNILGDVFNIEEQANATAKGFHREDVIGKNTLTLMNGWNKLSEGLLGIADFGNKTSQSLTNRAGYNRHQNNGDNNISNYFNIGTVGENISLDDMVDKVSSALREIFSAGTNIVHHGR